jgi:hypothetical protein
MNDYEGCTCEFDGDGECSEVPTKIKVVKAKILHHCEECHGEIKPGEMYERVDGRWENEWMSIYTCIPCMKIRNHYVKGRYTYGCLRECLKECLGIDYLDHNFNNKKNNLDAQA